MLLNQIVLYNTLYRHIIEHVKYAWVSCAGKSIYYTMILGSRDVGNLEAGGTQKLLGNLDLD